MIVHKDIAQKTDEWFKIKHGKIGGSTAKGLTVKGDTLMVHILSQMCEDYNSDSIGFASKDMERGNELEPYAVRDLEISTGIKFLDIGWIEHDTIKLIGISPDGLNEDYTIACEIKCPSAKKHTETIRDNIIPLDNIHQCIHYFTVIDTLESLHFASYRPEHKYQPLFIKTITRDSLVDLGLKTTKEVEVIGKKGLPIKPKTVSIPDIRTVSQWVSLYEEKAIEMEIQLNDEINLIIF